jgi:hypothetical protein
VEGVPGSPTMPDNGFMPELMEGDYDCGVAALLTFLKNTTKPDATREQVKDALDWIEGRNNRSDTCWQHLRAHMELEFPTYARQGWTVPQLRAIATRIAPVVCLVRVGRFAWHWVVLARTVPGQLGFAWGFQHQLTWLTDDEFEKSYWRSSFLARVLACDRFAYTISESGEYTKSSCYMSFMHKSYRNVFGRLF